MNTYEQNMVERHLLHHADILAGDVAPGHAAGLGGGWVLGVGEVDAEDVYPADQILRPHRVLAARVITRDDAIARMGPTWVLAWESEPGVLGATQAPKPGAVPLRALAQWYGQEREQRWDADSGQLAALPGQEALLAELAAEAMEPALEWEAGRNLLRLHALALAHSATSGSVGWCRCEDVPRYRKGSDGTYVETPLPPPCPLVTLAEAMRAAAHGQQPDGSFVTSGSELSGGERWAYLHAPGKRGVLAGVVRDSLSFIVSCEAAWNARLAEKAEARRNNARYHDKLVVATRMLRAGMALDYRDGQRGGYFVFELDTSVSARGVFRRLHVPQGALDAWLYGPAGLSGRVAPTAAEVELAKYLPQKDGSYKLPRQLKGA